MGMSRWDNCSPQVGDAQKPGKLQQQGINLESDKRPTTVQFNSFINDVSIQDAPKHSFAVRNTV